MKSMMCSCSCSCVRDSHLTWQTPPSTRLWFPLTVWWPPPPPETADQETEEWNTQTDVRDASGRRSDILQSRVEDWQRRHVMLIFRFMVLFWVPTRTGLRALMLKEKTRYLTLLPLFGFTTKTPKHRIQFTSMTESDTSSKSSHFN